MFKSEEVEGELDMLKQRKTPLFIFEMANNHQGDVEHGLRIIHEISSVCNGFPFDFAFKFQYRDLDTFIHPDYKNNREMKQVKRFEETRLSQEEFSLLKSELDQLGFLSICTPFDEKSVEQIEEQEYSILKIASCSFTDWPLLERIAKTNLPLIASTAGVDLEDIDNVVSFFRHRKKELALMHCVAEYPTPNQNLQLNQIDFLRKRYPEITVGYSTHEKPSDFHAVQLAVAKGAVIFEKHVGLPTKESGLNAYSANPEEVKAWLTAAQDAYEMCGLADQHRPVTAKEKVDLKSLQRGAFACKEIKKGEKIEMDSIFFAIPSTEGQVMANDMSKYTLYYSNEDIKVNQSIYHKAVLSKDIRPQVLASVTQVKDILRKSDVPIPEGVSFELSHHYGLEQFDQFGVTIVNCINREYCKKILVMIPGQKHPSHYHQRKEETFHILYGEMMLELDGVVSTCKRGDMVLVERGIKHRFWSETGVVFEEISTTHYANDSFYEDPNVCETQKRKTGLTYWFED